MRTLIVDDEPLAIERLQILCARLETLHLVGTASDGAAALRLVEALAPDLILLDIAMPGMDGIEIARALGGSKAPPAVIFVTAFDHFAVAAFDVAAVDYLLKPIAPDRLERAIQRITREQDAAPADGEAWAVEFWVPHRDEIIRINAADIDLIEAERDYMRLHIGNRSFLLHETITGLEAKLDPALFIRLHRSTIARRDHITALRYEPSGHWVAQLRDGKSARIGRLYLGLVRALAGR